MKINYSIDQRNQIVEEHLWCIKTVMRSNSALIRAARMDRDDVYQQLAIRLIKAVVGFDPDKGTLEQHIFAQLQYEMLNCKRPYRLYGITGAPSELRGKIISFDAIHENSELYEQLAVA